MVEYIECTECHNIVEYDKGIDHEKGFICHICIQDDFYKRLDEFENDPLHKDIPVEDLFKSQEKKFIKTYIIALCLSLLAIISIITIIIKQGDNNEQDNQPSQCSREWNK